MKTTLKIHHVWGTTNTICVYLTYRGRVLVEFAGHNADKAELITKAQTWANHQGYKL